MRPLSTVRFILANPNRSPFWKVFDVALLVSLWSAAAVSFALSGFNAWSIAARILIPAASIASARSWYRHPNRGARRTVDIQTAAPRATAEPPPDR